jgi:hypothetical protein
VRHLRDVRETAEIGTDIARGGVYTPRQWARRTYH